MAALLQESLSMAHRTSKPVEADRPTKCNPGRDDAEIIIPLTPINHFPARRNRFGLEEVPDRTAHCLFRAFQQRRTWIVPAPVGVVNPMIWWIETAGAENPGRHEIPEFIAPDVAWIKL
jgi:hypothetical protein